MPHVEDRDDKNGENKVAKQNVSNTNGDKTEVKCPTVFVNFCPNVSINQYLV